MALVLVAIVVVVVMVVVVVIVVVAGSVGGGRLGNHLFDARHDLVVNQVGGEHECSVPGHE